MVPLWFRYEGGRKWKGWFFRKSLWKCSSQKQNMKIKQFSEGCTKITGAKIQGSKLMEIDARSGIHPLIRNFFYLCCTCRSNQSYNISNSHTTCNICFHEELSTGLKEETEKKVIQSLRSLSFSQRLKSQTNA